MSACTVTRCERPVKAKGWCETHYLYARRGHDMSKAKPVQPRGWRLSKEEIEQLNVDPGKDPEGVIAAQWVRTPAGQQYVDVLRDGESVNDVFQRTTSDRLRKTRLRPV